MRKNTVYLDTSVINFLFADDAPYLKTATIDFFDNFVKTVIHETYISEYVLLEINKTSDREKKEKLIKSNRTIPNRAN